MANESNYEPDYSQYNEDSVPPPEREINHTHPHRPDLDYDDTPVGPAPGEGPNETHHERRKASDEI